MDRKLNKKKIIILILAVLLIALMFTFFILYKNNPNIRAFADKYIFRKNITENTLPQISIENNYNYSFNDNIVCLNKNSLNFYNKSANKIASIDLEVSNPIFQANGKYLCVAEKGGGKLYLINGKNISWQKDLEGKISSVSLNKNGYVIVSISDTTYETICKIFDSNGNELFTTYHSKAYVVGSSISSDNKYVALAEINFSGITIQSNIKIISIEKALSNNSESAEYTYSAPVGDFITNIEYDISNNLVCLYDNHIDIIKDNTNSEINNFEASNILFADVNNKLIQIEKKNTGLLSNEFELQFIDVSTLDKKIYTLDKEPKSLKVFGNVVAVNFGTQALFINNSGWLIKDYISSHEIQDIILSNDLAAIVYNDKIEILDL